MIQELEIVKRRLSRLPGFSEEIEVVSEAIDILEAQEPRVLTLDEALEADVCWLEISGSDRVSPCRIGGVNDFFSIRRFDQTPEVCAKKNYGWLLRCWSARPTDAQRKAVRWNDSGRMGERF